MRPKERGQAQDIEQDVSKENYINVENERLPGVETHIGSFVVAPDGQKEDRQDGSEVGECGNRVVRETGFGGIGCHLSLSEPGKSYRYKAARAARFLEFFSSKEPDQQERAVCGTANRLYEAGKDRKRGLWRDRG
jgi:hypothetical protein